MRGLRAHNRPPRTANTQTTSTRLEINIAEAAMPHMDITTVEQRPEDLAGAIVDLLLHRLGGEPAAGLQLLPPGPLVVRSSSGPPPLRAAAV